MKVRLKRGFVVKICFKRFLFHLCFLRFRINFLDGFIHFLQSKTSSTICQITLKDIKTWADAATDEEIFC